MKKKLIVTVLLFLGASFCARAAGNPFIGERKLNNLVSELLVVDQVGKPGSFEFSHSGNGWIFVALVGDESGSARVLLDGKRLELREHADGGDRQREAMNYVAAGAHQIRVEGTLEFGNARLVVRAIPELIHCGLGFDSQIKGYGHYDLGFLKSDVLPNVTTMIVPNNLKMDDSFVEDWHAQGKRLIGEIGLDGQGTTADDHLKFWSGFFERSPWLDGVIIDEFIVNRPVIEWAPLTPERLARMDKERKEDEVYGEAFKLMRADNRFKNKELYAYVGGSGKMLNQEIIGTNCIRNLINSGYHIALERYLHEMSSEQGSKDALQLLVDGISDWEAKMPGVKRQMVIAFGLLSMPPGSLNKLPNVDYHVWMDQQMNVVANNPALADIGGLNWWTSSLADEETVRFVGKLYRHYAIEGKTNMLTSDPLFMTHLQNPDFADGTNGWTLHSAEEGSIDVKSFPRYGRIEGRFMGLGTPPDPEHIGDTFLRMRRSAKAPNTFSQTIKDLEPGRLYSMKMFSCDYDDLVDPKPKKIEEANTVATVTIDGVDIDSKRSFTEVYSSSPEPKIPICIRYYWKVFRAKGKTAQLTVSDWKDDKAPGGPIGQEQAFNFLEVEPYHK